MKIGILFSAYNSEKYIDGCLTPWFNLKNKIQKTAIEYHSSNIKDTLVSTLLENGFVIEDIMGGSEVGLIYAYNKNFN